ncbi:hypothetical protein J2T56_003257 [Natronobacillus azotifigens]
MRDCGTGDPVPAVKKGAVKLQNRSWMVGNIIIGAGAIVTFLNILFEFFGRILI